MNKAKQSAGRLGGLATVAKHGREYMRTIGRRGAATTWRRYSIMPVDSSGYALVEKATGKVRAIWCAPWIVLCLALFLTGCEAWGFVPVATSTAPALATSSPEPTGTATVENVSHGTQNPTPTPARCIVTTGLEAGTVNVRGGPGMAYPVVDVVTEGQELPLIGEPVNGWQRVTTPALVEGWFYVIRWCKDGNT